MVQKGVATDLVLYPQTTKVSQRRRFHSPGSLPTADIARKLLDSSWGGAYQASISPVHAHLKLRAYLLREGN